jgi:hypothetical protein
MDRPCKIYLVKIGFMHMDDPRRHADFGWLLKNKAGKSTGKCVTYGLNLYIWSITLSH